MPHALTTARLILRPWRESDRLPFQAINADPRVMEHYPSTLTPQESDALIARINLHFELRGFGPYAAELAPIEISPSGFGIYFPKLDADLYLPALLEGFLGSRQWMASRLGSQGGKSTSHAKTVAAQRNGRAGGRPRKKTVAVA